MLSFDGRRTGYAAIGGTITDAPAPGTVVERGAPLFSIDGRRAHLFYGHTAPYRSLGAGAPPGDDIAVVEENLIALGFGEADLTSADREWSAATTNAVERWQKARGLRERDRTGVIEVSEIVIGPAATRVEAVLAPVGSRVVPGSAVLELTGTTKVVSVRLPADQRGLLTSGDAANVSIADGEPLGATVVHISRTAAAAGPTQEDGQDDGGGTPTLTVALALDDPGAVADLDGAPVSVRVERERREGVLAVPVEAIVALAEGGFAVRAVNRTGRSLTAVTVGMFDQGWVEVSGAGIERGLVVEVPR